MASDSEKLRKPKIIIQNETWRFKWSEIVKCRNQIFATAIATIGSFGTGTVFGWSAFATDDISKRKEFENISQDNEISWVTSLAILGAFLAGPAAGACMDRYGRRKSIMAFSFPFVLGWIVMCCAYFTSPQGFYLLYVGRLLTGFCAGCYLVLIPTYIKEISIDSMRGVLGSAMPLMLVSGILYTFIIGTYCHWALLTASCGIIPILLCLGTLIIPETPRFLIMKSELGKAVDSYKWLNSIKYDAGAAGDSKSEIQLCSGDGIITNEVIGQKRSWRQLLSRPVALPIAIMAFVMLFQQFGGVNAVTLYTVEIFRSSGTSNLIDPGFATIILGIFQVVFVLASMFLIDVLGRKTLLVSCSLIMGVCLVGLGIYFYLKEKGDGSEADILWLPVATTWTYIAAYSCGVGSVPWVLANELYNPDYRAQSATIMTSSYWIFGFIVAQTYGFLKKQLLDSGCFWFYGGFCIAGATFAILFVPETKGKSSEEILRYFGGGTEVKDGGEGDSDNNVNSNLTPSVESRMFISQSDTTNDAEIISNNKLDNV